MKGDGKLRKSRTDSGINHLLSIRKPGQTFSQREIAKACGCSYQLIWHIEHKALRKLKERMRRALGIPVRDFYSGKMEIL